MKYLAQIPTHVWLGVFFVILLIAYYVRPDPVTVDLVKAFSGALLLSLRAGVSGTPPAAQEPPKQ